MSAISLFMTIIIILGILLALKDSKDEEIRDIQKKLAQKKIEGSVSNTLIEKGKRIVAYYRPRIVSLYLYIYIYVCMYVCALIISCIKTYYICMYVYTYIVVL